jgi:hypothetical protein
VSSALAILLQVTIHCARDIGNEFQLLSARTGRLAEQTKHLCDLIKAFALQSKVHLWITVAGSRLNVAPEKIAELIHYASKVLYQSFVQKAIENRVLVVVTGTPKTTPLQLQPQGTEFSSQAVDLIRKVSHLSSLNSYSTHVDARKARPLRDL